MKLLSFVTPKGNASYGVLVEKGVVDLGAKARADGVSTLKQMLERGSTMDPATLVSATSADYATTDIKFLPVIPDPGKVICVGLNYRDHVAETGRTVTEKPALFARFPTSQVGHLEPIIRPRASQDFDYEGELAVVIGRSGRHIPSSAAFEHVAGYSCYNEGSIRDWQRHTSQFLSGKTFDRSGSFGPWLVTPEEIPDPGKLALETRLNGETVQKTTTDMLITGVADLIAYCSTIMTLLPGDVIVTGTPGGVGFKRTPPRFMKPGDIVEVEISGIGTLRNPVQDEA